jgi:hypothetical protein
MPVIDARGTEIPLQGSDEPRFHTRAGFFLAQGYLRVVIGRRGAYIEFTSEQIQFENLAIPQEQAWRQRSKNAFYIEYRSSDAAKAMVYHQKRLVNYADYKIGLFYIAPADLIFTSP